MTDTFNGQPYDDDFWPVNPGVTRFENYRIGGARYARRLATTRNPGFKVMKVTKIDEHGDDDELPGLYRVELWKLKGKP